MSACFLFSSIALIGVSSNTVCQSAEIAKEGKFREARMSFDGELLKVYTGLVSRTWKFNNRGLSTVNLEHRGSILLDQTSHSENECDWELGFTGDCELIELTAKRCNDDHFTSDHLCVTAVLKYPEDHLLLKYTIWAYPDAPGFRTQIHLKAMPGFDRSLCNLGPRIVESIQLNQEISHKEAFGLMQGIKSDGNDSISREENILPSQKNCHWANGVSLATNDSSICCIKESNKHTRIERNADVDTGGFIFRKDKTSVTGVGLYPKDICHDSYRSCWATWTIFSSEDPLENQLNRLRFDRLRYPINPNRDIYIMANTWGSEDERPSCLHAAREENVLRELESVSDLGIDVLQIDDGWQTPQWTTAATSSDIQHGKKAFDMFGAYHVYPNGWTRVRKKADELGITLGLWAAWTAPLDSLNRNYDLGNFKYFKLDFANLSTKERYDNLALKARKIIEHSGHTARVNWDVTEFATRMGYFSGREYGNVYLANRKTLTARKPVLYIPHKVLNEAWNLSKFVNLNKFQVTVQNIDRVFEDAPTDAKEHSHEYAVGIALMSSPIFFQETRHYQGEARQQIRDILSTYKQHRKAMYGGYVFPIGDEPNNRSWTGFQNHDPITGNGYLTIFRERLNTDSTSQFQLKFIEDAHLKVTNLLNGESSLQTVGQSGEMTFTLEETPGFLFIRYEAVPQSATASSNENDRDRR